MSSPTDTISPAPLWRRFLAYLIDATMLSLLWQLVALVVPSVLVGLGQWGTLIGWALAIPWFRGPWDLKRPGLTLGQLFLRLRTVSLSGGDPSPRALWLRGLWLATVTLGTNADWSALGPFGGGKLAIFLAGQATAIPVVYALWSRRGVFHDRWTGTTVVRSTVSEAPVSIPTRPIWPTVAIAAVLGAALLQAQIWMLSDAKGSEQAAALAVALEDAHLCEKAEVHLMTEVSHKKGMFTWTSNRSASDDEAGVKRMVLDCRTEFQDATANYKRWQEVIAFWANRDEGPSSNAMTTTVGPRWDMGVAHGWVDAAYEETAAASGAPPAPPEVQ